ncbi:MAG: endonuclease/exonuclease/phosphatase family protein [Actinomycetota bacterium]|nr:endonuclease/exonuclease/phosphatase family protein [Actinomycetota bacterium]
MRIVTWNVNSLKVRLPRVLEFLAEFAPDVLCLQETKVEGDAATGLLDAYREVSPEGERYTWWDYRAGRFHKNLGMRIDHVLLTPDLAARLVACDIARDYRKGSKPSDHAPLVADLT